MEVKGAREAFDLFNPACRNNFKRSFRRGAWKKWWWIRLVFIDTWNRVCSNPDYTTLLYSRPQNGPRGKMSEIDSKKKSDRNDKIVITEKDFYAHAHRCKQCRNNRLDLCPVGIILLEGAVKTFEEG